MFIFKLFWFVVSMIGRMIALVILCFIIARGSNAIIEDIKEHGIESELSEAKRMAVGSYLWLKDNHQDLLAQLNHEINEFSSENY